MKKAKVAATNLLGVVIAVITFFVAAYVITYIMGLFLSIPIFSTLLSWPSTPMLYALSAASLGATFSSAFVCKKICLPNVRGKKLGFLVFTILLAGSAIFVSIDFLISVGFNDAFWSIFWVPFAAVSIFLEENGKHPFSHVAPLTKDSDCTLPKDAYASNSALKQAPLTPRFCKHCGTAYTKENAKCPNCGKRVRLFVFKQPSHRAVVVVLSAFIFALSAFSFYQSTAIRRLENAQLLQTQIIQELTTESQQYRSKANFLDNSVAFLTPTGEKYHKLNCQFIEKADYYRCLDVGTAQTMGYGACSICH